MTFIKSIDEIKEIKESVITIGNFDGVHKGHKVLIEKAVEYSIEKDYKSVVFTFENHPANYFTKDAVKKIITNEYKSKKIKELGIDIVISIPFDEYMTKVSARDFVKEILMDKLGMKKLVVGHDFTFARNKEGNVKLLEELSKEYDFELEVVSPIKINNHRVSSSLIRGLIKEGKMEEISEYLGHNYSLEGEIIHSKKLGRQIGFPTANMKNEQNLLLPKIGIYATKVYVNSKVYYGATNIGYNPTVNGKEVSVETNILDFNEDIYGQVIKIEFLERIRNEVKFESLKHLTTQLEKDTNFVYEKYICKTM